MGYLSKLAFRRLFLRDYVRSGIGYLSARIPTRAARALGLDEPLKSWSAKLRFLAALPFGLLVLVVVRAVHLVMQAILSIWGFSVRQAIRPVHLHKRIVGLAAERLVADILGQEDSPEHDALIVELVDSVALDGMTLAALAGSLAKGGKLEMSRHVAETIVERLPDNLPALRQAGVETFLGGEYELAEFLWGEWHRRRETMQVLNGLVDFEPKLLGITWLIAIGHIAHLDTYFKWRELQGRRERVAFNVPPDFRIPNNDLLDRWQRYLGIRLSQARLPANEAHLELVQDEFWGLPVADGRFRMFSYAGAWVQSEWARQKRGPLLSLSQADHEKAAPILARLGVRRGAWYVCLHVREPGFHEAWHKKNPGTRNADIDTYADAAKAIIARGGFVIRMGDPTMKKLRPILGVIDYAHSSERSEFMDIYLSASCKFFIGTNSGLGLVPPVFGVPCALTNWSPIGLPQWYPNDLFIPKLCFAERLGRYLTFEEMFHSKAGWGQFANYFEREQIRVEDNAPEDLCELALEMLDREQGVLDYNERDTSMQSRYESIATRAGGYLGARIGSRFLRKYSQALLPTAPAH